MELVPPLSLVVAVLLSVIDRLWPTARPWAGRAQLALGAVLLTTGVVLGLSWAPPDRYMGEVQRIMYVHVPLVWSAMLAAVVTLAGSVAFLWSSSPRASLLAEAASEIGVVLGGLGIVLGALWGRATWGVWWTWDPRLTATVVMLLLLAAGLVARRFASDAQLGAVIAAGLGCLQLLSLPLVVFSVRWWSTLHQLPSTVETVHPAIMLTLRWNAVAFLCLFLVLLRARVHLGAMRLQPSPLVD